MTAARRAGVVTFAGVLFLIVAAFTAIDGIVALAQPKQFFVSENAVVVHNYDAYGVVLLVLATVQALVGWGLLTGSRVARVLAIILAGASFLIQLAFFKHYPAWATTVMVLDFIIIYGLCVHGEDFPRRARR
jgi:hypothetical protein